MHLLVCDAFGEPAGAEANGEHAHAMQGNGYKGDNTVKRRKQDASRLLAIEEGHHRLDVREGDVEERVGRELCEETWIRSRVPKRREKATHEFVLRITYDELRL
jgi:hypothetical protein